MAAGTSRILRYVLFAFFVGVMTIMGFPQADSTIGYYDPLFYILLLHTETGHARWLEL